MLNKLPDNTKLRLVNQISFFTEKAQYQKNYFCSVDGNKGFMQKNKLHEAEKN